MRENKFRKWIRTEIETEAEALEKKAEENTELSSLHMPEDSFADLMSRIEAEKKNAAGNSSAIRPFHIRRRTLVAVALAAGFLAGPRPGRQRRKALCSDGGERDCGWGV